MINNFKNVCIISPHPDDETLGVGGTISRLINQNSNVNVLVVGGHLPPVYESEEFTITQKECLNAMKQLGLNDNNIEFLKLPATTFNQFPIHVFNKKIDDFIKKHDPDCVFIPFSDRHIDHKIVFEASIVACRPNRKNFPKAIFCYETLSETHWNVSGVEAMFNPDFFINITPYMENKINALKCYKSQIENSYSRGLEANYALASFRGTQNNCKYAEAFKVIRVFVD